MKFALENPEGFVIQSYHNAEIVVGGRTYRKHLIVMPKQIIEDWPPLETQALRFEHLQMALHPKLEVLLLGTGAKQYLPALQYAAPLAEKGIGFEVMDTAAACRTYNILLSESRQVAAALFIK